MGYVLSVVIPCYNSGAYMANAINAALSGGPSVEVIIVNDGSSDNTFDIGLSYYEKYNGRVVLINKENGGHGDAVMAGVKRASGTYVKILDSDDLLDTEALKNVVALLTKFVEEDNLKDLVIANYVYCKEGSGDYAVKYTSSLPVNKDFTWEEVGHFPYGTYLLMHAMIYRTQLLIDCGLQIPKHTFYVDNIYAYYPLPYVNSIYYIDENLYLYSIGREDQSVNQEIMIKRIGQQIFVTETMRDMYHLNEIMSKPLRDYMTSYLTIMYTVCTALLIESGTEENLALKRKLWEDFEHKDYKSYRVVRKKLLGWIVSRDGSFWNTLVHGGYKFYQKTMHFN